MWLHELQHTRLPCPSLSPRVCSDSCPLSQWCHPTISSSVTPFSSCPQSLPASGSQHHMGGQSCRQGYCTLKDDMELTRSRGGDRGRSTSNTLLGSFHSWQRLVVPCGGISDLGPSDGSVCPPSASKWDVHQQAFPCSPHRGASVWAPTMELSGASLSQLPPPSSLLSVRGGVGSSGAGANGAFTMRLEDSGYWHPKTHPRGLPWWSWGQWIELLKITPCLFLTCSLGQFQCSKGSTRKR